MASALPIADVFKGENVLRLHGNLMEHPCTKPGAYISVCTNDPIERRSIVFGPVQVQKAQYYEYGLNFRRTLVWWRGELAPIATVLNNRVGFEADARARSLTAAAATLQGVARRRLARGVFEDMLKNAPLSSEPEADEPADDSDDELRELGLAPENEAAAGGDKDFALAEYDDEDADDTETALQQKLKQQRMILQQLWSKEKADLLATKQRTEDVAANVVRVWEGMFVFLGILPVSKNHHEWSKIQQLICVHSDKQHKSVLNLLATYQFTKERVLENTVKYDRAASILSVVTVPSLKQTSSSAKLVYEWLLISFDIWELLCDE